MALFLQSADSLAALVELISPQQLSRQAGEVIVIDARPHAEWREGHLPGALSLDWQQYTVTDAQGVAYRRLPGNLIAARLGRMGIAERSAVVVYGDADSTWGGEGWVCWLLRFLGHSGDLYLLDGGVQAWQRQIGGLSREEPQPRPPVVYRFAERSELDLETERLLGEHGLQLIDTRSFFESLGGSLPGAVRIVWSDFFQGAERRPLRRDELLSLLGKHGVDPQRPVAYFCSGGIRSAYAWTVHALAGLPQAKNYEGGMAAWRQRR